MTGLSLVHQLTVPTGLPVGTVNLYALKTSAGYYLIDGGVATEEAKKLIRDWLPSPLVGILITHGHPDHLGIAWELAEEHECPIYLNSEELSRLKEPELQRKVIDRLLVQGGLPEEELHPVSEGYEKIRKIHEMKATGVIIKELLPGQRFATELGDLEVVYTPGHSSGHCCFYLINEGKLFSGDHILPNISPNPILAMGKDGKRRRVFIEYLESLNSIESLSVNMVYPGHGKPFNNLSEVMDRFRAYHCLREQGILAMLSDEPQTPYQIAQKVYPEMKGMDIFLGISKVWGHLDLLEPEGKVLSLQKKGLTYYRLLRVS